MADAVAFDSGALPNLPMQVKAKTLLAMMITAPLGIVAAMIDAYGFNNALRNYAFENPSIIVWWVAVLSTPHIIASLVTFADREYLHHYAKPLKKAAIISVILGFCIPLVVGFILKPPYTDMDLGHIAHYGADVSMVIAAFYTTYHNLQQQYGVGLMLMKQKPEFIHQLWKWITIVPAGFIFLGMQYNHEGLVWDMWPRVVAMAVTTMIVACIVGGIIIRQYLKRPDHSKIGLMYFCANAAMLLISLGLCVKGYVMIAMLMPRVIHDLTAYWIYMVHDENRNADKMRNPFYAPFKKLGIGPAILCVPLSFVLAYIMLNASREAYIISAFVFSLNYMHYYLESIIWKRGTPHRQYVPFT
ncbi:MAG: hypothetical protein KGQ41_07390 [Alphaproteobacteria bacterium]|nr:hypothetical protein [Alphaproteobacteria bacterium]